MDFALEQEVEITYYQDTFKAERLSVEKTQVKVFIE